MPSAWFEQDLDPMAGKKPGHSSVARSAAEEEADLSTINRKLEKLLNIMEKDGK